MKPHKKKKKRIGYMDYADMGATIVLEVLLVSFILLVGLVAAIYKGLIYMMALPFVLLGFIANKLGLLEVK